MDIVFNIEYLDNEIMRHGKCSFISCIFRYKFGSKDINSFFKIDYWIT
jgi:hypothetical protein